MEIGEKVVGWLQENDDPDVIAVVENRTDFAWRLMDGTSAPIHGDWMTTPPTLIGPISALDGSQDKNMQGSPVGGMDLDGAGSGSVSLAIYQCDDGSANPMVICFYLRKTPGKRFKAGAWVTSLSGLKLFDYLGEGDGVSDYIQGAGHLIPSCAYSDDGSHKSATNFIVTVGFMPNNEDPYRVVFSITS